MDIHNIGVTPMPMSEGVMGGMRPMETGEFDFLEYFLGLQIGATPQNDPLVPGSDLLNPLTAETMDGAVPRAVAQTLQGSGQTQSPEMQLVNELFPEVGATKLQAEGPKPEVVLRSVHAERGAELPWTPAELDVAQRIRGSQAEIGRDPMKPALSAEGSEVKGPVLSPASAVEMTAVETAGVETEIPLEDRVEQDAQPGEEFSLDSGSETITLDTKLSADAPFTVAHSARAQSVGSEVKLPEIHIPEESLKEVASGIQNLRDTGGGTMKISLNPPELGEVEIQVTNHGKDVGIEIRSENLTTKSLLESNLGSLKSAIHSHDLTISKLEVQQGSLEQNTDRNGSMMSFSEQYQDGGDQGKSWRGLNRYHQAASQEPSVSAAGTVPGAVRSESRVDLRV